MCDVISGDRLVQIIQNIGIPAGSIALILNRIRPDITIQGKNYYTIQNIYGSLTQYSVNVGQLTQLLQQNSVSTCTLCQNNSLSNQQYGGSYPRIWLPEADINNLSDVLYGFSSSDITNIKNRSRSLNCGGTIYYYKDDVIISTNSTPCFICIGRAAAVVYLGSLSGFNLGLPGSAQCPSNNNPYFLQF